MERTHDIVLISLPFVGGVVLTQLAVRLISRGLIHVPAAIAVFIPLCTMLALATGKHSERPYFAILFLLAGIFCSISRGLSGGAGAACGPLTGLCRDAALRLKAVITAIPFRHERSNGLLTALLTGDRNGISREDIGLFRASGASHILALSGLHLGIIYTFVGKILAILGHTPAARKVRSGVTVLLAGAYTVMTGAGPSIVRAFLFILLTETARLNPDRKRISARILPAAMTIQLAMKPEVISDIGFQLSYLAMTGIVFIYPRLAAWYPADGAGRDPLRRIWQSTALTLSCQLATAPLAWIYFHTFPKYFLITNLVAMPLTSAIVTVSLVTVILSAAGCCPGVLVQCSDFLLEMLMRTLETIGKM